MTRYTLYLGDCLSWMEKREKDSIHAIVTDPPYGLKEYTTVEKEKLRKGNGGVWRIPPSFDGCKRRPESGNAGCHDRIHAKRWHVCARESLPIFPAWTHFDEAQGPLLHGGGRVSEDLAGYKSNPSPGPRRLVKTPVAGHPLPKGVCVITRVCVSFRGAAGNEESRTALKIVRARFLAPLGMTA
ncbi:MAG: hypothetical protein ABSH01_12555 [Terriglobia bacterium]